MKKLRILNVDDTVTSRYSVTRELKLAGFEVDEASTGKEALKLSESLPDLILLDVQLPDISGFEVCGRVRANPATASIPILHLSAARISNEDQALGLEGGADGYLTHPFDPLVLIATARALIRMRGAENELRAEKAKQTQTLEKLQLEKDLRERFVAALTHDLRTPLTAAKLCAELMLRKSDEPGNTQRLSSRIVDNIDRADTMIRNLLDANRIQAGEKLPLKISECDMLDSIRDAVQDLATIHGDRVYLKSGSTGVRGYWDCDGLRRIVDNLCNNAFKYGSPIKPVTVGLKDLGEQVEISVHNYGTPLSAHETEQLFGLFQRSAAARKSGQQGWGLGLTLVRGVAEAHGGAARVESSAEAGTTFFVLLPKDSRSAQAGDTDVV